MKLPRAGATLALGDAEIAAAYATYEDIRAGRADARHLRDASLSWQEHALCLALPAVGASIRLHTRQPEPRLARCIDLDDITAGSVTFFDVEALERYVSRMEKTDARAQTSQVAAA